MFETYNFLSLNITYNNRKYNKSFRSIKSTRSYISMNCYEKHKYNSIIHLVIDVGNNTIVY